MVAIVNVWSDVFAQPVSSTVTPPPNASLAVPVSNKGWPSRNMLVALTAIRQPAGFTTSVAVGDDSALNPVNPAGSNFWEPCGIPGGSSSSQAGLTRVSAWYCRNAAAASNVYLSPDGLYLSAGLIVVELSGFGPFGIPLAGITRYLAAVTSLALTGNAPSGSTVYLTCMAGDLVAGQSVGGPGAGWTSIGAASVEDGFDTAEDLSLTAAFRTNTTTPAATWTASTAMDMAGLIVAIPVTGTSPAPLSQIWPRIQFQAAFGSGAQTPWDQMTWTDLTTRFRELSAGRGKQYELDVIQSGTHTYVLSNNDGALFPGNVNSPYQVDVYTPVRLLATWPPPPAAGGFTYSVARGYMERWPSSLTQARYQLANAVAVDAWAMLTPLLQSVAYTEILTDQPGWFWPLSDPAGSVTGSNLSPFGDGGQLQVVSSKYGAGTATQSFGDAVEGLSGAPSSDCWTQAGVPASGTQGYCLYYSDTALPPPGGAVTIAIWANLGAQPAGALGSVIMVKNAHGPMLNLYVQASTGNLLLDTYTKASGAKTTFTVSNADMLTSTWTHFALQFSAGVWGVLVNGAPPGGSTATSGGSCTLNTATNWWVSYAGHADRVGTGGFLNGSFALAEITGRALPTARVASHYLAALTGLAGQDTATDRAERLLLAGSVALPRIAAGALNSAVSSLVAGAVDVDQTAVAQNVTNVTESDNSLVLVTSAGYLYIQSRQGGYNQATSWTLGDTPAPALNANPYFNGTTAPWTVTGGTIGLSVGWAKQGTQSASLTPTGSASNPQFTSEAIPCTAGQSYSHAPWLNMVSGSWGAVVAQLAWYANSGGTGSPITTTSGTPVAIATGIPDQALVSGQAPQGALSFRLVVQMTGTPAAADVLLMDQAAGTTTYTEQPYLADFTTDFDPTQVFNDLQLTQIQSPVVLTYRFSAVTTGSLFTATGSALPDGQQVTLTGSLPGGFTQRTAYFVINPAGDQFQLSATSGGSAITVTAAGIGTLTAVVQNTGATITLASQASITQYNDQNLQQTVYLQDFALITDLANWIFNTFGTPQVRVSRMTFDAAANPALFPLVLSLETGVVVRVIRRLSGTLVEMDETMVVMTVGHEIGPGKWQTAITAVVYPGRVLQADHPVYGNLDGTNAIGF